MYHPNNVSLFVNLINENHKIFNAILLHQCEMFSGLGHHSVCRCNNNDLPCHLACAGILVLWKSGQVKSLIRICFYRVSKT